MKNAFKRAYDLSEWMPYIKTRIQLDKLYELEVELKAEYSTSVIPFFFYDREILKKKKVLADFMKISEDAVVSVELFYDNIDKIKTVIKNWDDNKTISLEYDEISVECLSTFLKTNWEVRDDIEAVWLDIDRVVNEVYHYRQYVVCAECLHCEQYNNYYKCVNAENVYTNTISGKFEEREDIKDFRTHFCQGKYHEPTVKEN